MGSQGPKIGGNWPLTGPYLHCCQFHYSHQKFIFWSKLYICMVKTFLERLCSRFLFHAQNVSSLQCNLSCKTWNISHLSVLLWNKKHLLCTGLFSAFLRFQVSKWFCWSILSFACCSLIWLLLDVASSEGLCRYGTIIVRYIHLASYLHWVSR